MRKLLWTLLLLATLPSARATLFLDDKWPWDAWLNGQPASDIRRKEADPIEAAVNRDLAALGFEKNTSWETLNTFRMVWDGQVYFVAGWQYDSKEQTKQLHEHLNGPMPLSLPGGGICSLFVYDEHLKLQAKHDLYLPEQGGNTWCNGSDALAQVKGQDALLFSVSYYISGRPPAKRIEDIGDEWRYSTFLLRLKREGGKVLIRQDDACLGNPNHYKTIADARRALKMCAEYPGLSTQEISQKVAEYDAATIKKQENQARQHAPAKFRPWIADGFKLLNAEEGDLDGDGLADATLVLESNDQSTRRLLILKGTSSPGYVLTGQSDKIVDCRDCGGLLTTDDPFMGITLGKNRFTVKNGIWGGRHWSNSLTFAWSRTDKQWQLVSVAMIEAHSGADGGMEGSDCTYKPPKDFGKISLEQIDSEKGFLKADAKGSCQ